jgi:hemerythrin
MNAVRDWLVSHIQKMDKKYGSHVNKSGSGPYAAKASSGRSWKTGTGSPTA